MHEHLQFTPLESVNYARHYATFFKANVYKPIGQNTDSQQATAHGPWAAPSPGWVKLNFDASTPGNGQMGGIASVARDHTGLILAWSRKKLQGLPATEVAEAYAAHLAVLLAKEMGYQQVVLEGDSLLVVQGINSSNQHSGVADHLYQQINGLLSFFDIVLVRHIRREANGLADKLSRNIGTNSNGFGALPFEYTELT